MNEQLRYQPVNLDQIRKFAMRAMLATLVISWSSLLVARWFPSVGMLTVLGLFLNGVYGFGLIAATGMSKRPIGPAFISLLAVLALQASAIWSFLWMFSP